jgi:hypothetical protein
LLRFKHPGRDLGGAMRILSVFLICLISAGASAAPVEFTIEQLGITDEQHTTADGLQRSGVYKQNGSYVVGFSWMRGVADTYTASSTWIYDGNQIKRIGLYDALHTGADGRQYSSTYGSYDTLSTGGKVAGFSRQYGGANFASQSAWVYDGQNTTRIGIYDAEHTGSAGVQSSGSTGINDAGQVIGGSTRYDVAGAYSGATTWVYDDGTTTSLGFTSGQYQRSDGFRRSQALNIAGNGRVTGKSIGFYGAQNTEGETLWSYLNGTTTRIGLYGAEHTRITDGFQESESFLDPADGSNFVNSAGQVIGWSNRYSAAGSFDGRSAWIYDGNSIARIGLTSGVHTTSAGYQNSYVWFLNEAGQAAGESSRFTSDGYSLGESAWVYDGSMTTRVGLTDAAHTGDGTNSLLGYQRSDVTGLSDTGQAIGNSRRFYTNPQPGQESQSAWLYDGNSTQRIGLTDAQHTRSADEYQKNKALRINNVGQAAGKAERFDANGNLEGESAWFFDGNTSIRVGIDGAAYAQQIMQATGAFLVETDTQVEWLTDTGLIAGSAGVYGWTGPPNCAGFSCPTPKLAQVAWLYDGSQTIAFDSLGSGSGSSIWSEIELLTEDGLVLGRYGIFDTYGSITNYQAFAYSDEWGTVDLKLAIDDSFDEQMWEYLGKRIGLGDPEAQLFSDGFAIYGTGILENGSDMGYVIRQATAVPIPAAGWLFGSALAGLGWMRRKQTV